MRPFVLATILVSACSPAPPAPRAVLVPLPAGAGPEVPRWSITSDPARASVWIDGVDTRTRTPATFAAPPAGKYTLRLALDGYADEIEVITQQPGYGLSLGRNLRPRSEVEHEAASQRAAARPVDEAAREATRRFLGDDLRRVRIEMVSSRSVSVPQVTVRVRGDGVSEVRWTWLGDDGEKVLPVTVGADEVKRIFEAAVSVGLVDVVGADRPGIPDEVTFGITVTNGSGASVSASKWDGDQHPRLDPIIALLTAVVRKLPPEVVRTLGYAGG